MNKQIKTDVLIIGSGAAGLALALHLAENCHVVVLSKTSLREGASYYAQGGVAAVATANLGDSFEAHIQDTLTAGRGLCQYKAVEYVVKNAKKAIDWLINIGVDFTQEINEEGVKQYHLIQEGGHTHRRIWHAADATGKAVKDTLDARVLAHPNIEIIEQAIVIDLIKKKERCVGAYFLDEMTSQVKAIVASQVVLATGGASKAYLYSTSPVVSSWLSPKASATSITASTAMPAQSKERVASMHRPGNRRHAIAITSSASGTLSQKIDCQP